MAGPDPKRTLKKRVYVAGWTELEERRSANSDLIGWDPWGCSASNRARGGAPASRAECKVMRFTELRSMGGEPGVRCEADWH